MGNPKTNSKIAETAGLSFEQAMEELEKIVRRLEQGQSKLEDAISDYERGVALKKHCEDRLREAQLKVDKISIGNDGKVSLTNFDS